VRATAAHPGFARLGQLELKLDAFALCIVGNPMFMSKGDVHVVPSSEGWRVEVAADGRARSVHRTQAEARLQARDIARRNKREFVARSRP
jgi:hypothetical protein